MDQSNTGATSESAGNAAQIAYWNDRAAVSWVAWQERLDALFAPLTEVAMDAAAVLPGERVLDIGCGCGGTVLELARRVGDAGNVFGVDVSAPMVARARQRITAAGLGNTAVEIADAASWVFAQSDFDVLFSRFGVMFFDDPVAAFANLRGAMRPGGRLLFACWRPLEESSWFSVPLDTARPILPPEPPAEPGAPGPFAFADEAYVRRLLAVAGWSDVALRQCDVPMRIAGPGEIAEASEFSTRIGGLARLLADADDSLRARVKDLVAEALRGHDGADGIVLRGAIWLVSARAY